MDRQLEIVRQDIRSVRYKVVGIKQHLAAAKQARKGEKAGTLFGLLLSPNNQQQHGS